MSQPPTAPAEPANNGPVLFVGLAIITLAVVMIIAAQRDNTTEVVTVGEATPEQIATGQTALATVGCYTGEIDGKYGTLTDQAIVDFQQAAGITVDGVFGPDTLAALQDAVDAGATVCTPPESDTGDAGDSTGDTEGTTGDEAEGTTGDTGDEPEGTTGDTREATLSSASYGPETFTVTSWDCTGEPGDLAFEGTSDTELTIVVAMTDGTGTLVVDGGTEQDGITLNGTMATLTKEPAAFSATGVFEEPNLIGETYELIGTC